MRIAPVIPAQTGIQTAFSWVCDWIPACAGMTLQTDGIRFSLG